MRSRLLFMLTLLTFSCAFLFPLEGQAQDVDALQKEVENLRSEVQKLKTKNDEYEFLKEQIKEFKDSAERELGNYRTFVEGEWNKFLNFLYVVGGLAVFFVGWEYFTFRRRLKKKYDELLKEATEEIETQKIEIEKEINKKWDQFVKENKLKKRVDDLERLMQNERRYKKAKVLVLGSEADLNAMKEYLDLAMTQRGMKEPEYLPLGTNPKELPKEEIKKKLENKEVVVYYYDHKKKKHDQENNEDLLLDYRMRELMNFLSEENIQIPTIVYTYKKDEDGWMQKKDKKFLNKFVWQIPANSPLTLLGHIFTYIHALPPKKEG